ncbi:SDR family NAD(P)-dependent oxidoreductase [Streptomyces sp. NBC_00322]|uniref:SDR family NAD(P)-dependent oxidoreductase n=1 Tax=Streptomyces sp. NBC_00322 TaxID=2975712 RepID=UPI002E2B3C28|nr:SDR family NAD(P)-dependent oxidoreductase [Streptomyces sp. NBC_00322]
MNQRTTLVTGATQGLGRAIALDLASRGHPVLLHGRDHTRLEAVATEIQDATPDATVHTSGDQQDQRVRGPEPSGAGRFAPAGVGAGRGRAGRVGIREVAHGAQDFAQRWDGGQDWHTGAALAVAPGPPAPPP